MRASTPEHQTESSTTLCSAEGTGVRRTRHADLEWAASGAMALTGRHDGPPLLAPAPFATRARDVLAAVAREARDAGLPGAEHIASIDGPALLGERAACAGFVRRGTTSPGGTCHLMRCADGWIAVNLARTDDVALVPAWLEASFAGDAKDFIERSVRHRSAGALVDRARLLGMPVAPASQPASPAPHWYRCKADGVRTDRPRATRAGTFHSDRRPLVVDLSSLWAGPLCAHLLAVAGARVIKVESTRRLDGARGGAAAFYDLMNAGKDAVTLDFTTPEGKHLLAAIVERADIVVESSRPRALEQLGIVAGDLLRARPGLVWTSITGYGRDQPQSNWIAFGDDAAAAAGVAMATAGADTAPLFCGDAIADPLTGMHAALAALHHWARGESVLLDLSLHGVTAYCSSLGIAGTRARVRSVSTNADTETEVTRDGDAQIVVPPRARTVVERAHAPGADTSRVLASLAITC